MNVSILLILFLVGALATFLLGDKKASKVALGFSILPLLLTVYLMQLYYKGDYIGVSLLWIKNPEIYFQLYPDGLALSMVLLTVVLTPLIIVSSFGKQIENAKSFYALLLFMAFAMTGTFLASDGFLYYIFWELALLPIFFMILFWGNDSFENRKKATLKFFIYTFAGSLFMMAAFIYLYYRVGSFVFFKLYTFQFTPLEEALLFLAFFLAYAIKIPLVPFHSWQANTYAKAPTVGTMLLSGIMLKMGIYSVLRWQLPISGGFAREFQSVLIAISLVGVIYGGLLALQQKNLKKVLAYSSLSHVGLITAGCYTLNLNGMKGAVLQMLAHGLVIVGLFFVNAIIYRRWATRNIDEMGGIRSLSPVLATYFLLLVLASVALPGTFNFIGEFMVLYSLSQVQIIWAAIGGLTIILGAFYMLKTYQTSMLGNPEGKTFVGLSISEKAVLFIIVALIVVLGIYPTPVLDLITPSLQNIIKYI